MNLFYLTQIYHCDIIKMGRRLIKYIKRGPKNLIYDKIIERLKLYSSFFLRATSVIFVL